MRFYFELLKAAVDWIKESIWLCVVLYVTYRMWFNLPIEGTLEEYTRYGLVFMGTVVLVMWVVGLITMRKDPDGE